jgi:hypothetical protein
MCSNSLLPVFKRGKTDTWLELRTAESSSSSSTVSRSAGEVRLVLEFEGPPGVAYPQQRPGVVTFDDSARVNLKAQVKPLVLACYSQLLQLRSVSSASGMFIV